jgi:hypothetical protein
MHATLQRRLDKVLHAQIGSTVQNINAVLHLAGVPKPAEILAGIWTM